MFEKLFMSFAVIAILGYFFLAIAALLDKYILSDEHMLAPATYAFYGGVFSLFTLAFVPFGFGYLGIFPTGILLLSGIFFLYGLLFLYQAIRKGEISRVAPLVGTIIALTVFLAPFVPGVFGEPVLDIYFILALILLIGGGFLISFDFPLKKGEVIPGEVITAGILFGIHFLLLKYGYGHTDFINGLIWSRIGIFLGALTLLFIPLFRREIFSRSRHMRTKPKHALGTLAVFTTNKACAGLASYLVAYASFLGSVALVQALNGLQYVFLLLLMIPIAFRYPDIFREKLHFWDWFQKVIAIIIIGLGLFLASVGGVWFLNG